ncbi:MAG: hypothetical protein QXS66_08530 [Thermoproteota archaeon]
MLKAIQPLLTHVSFYVILLVMLLFILPTTATPEAFEIVSLTSDIYKVRGGQTARITVKVRNNLGFKATAVILVDSKNQLFFFDIRLATITLEPGEEGDVYFGAYYGGDEEKTDEIIILVEDAEGHLCDRKTLTLQTASPVALFLDDVKTGGAIESGKWTSLEVTVTNKQGIAREAEVRVEAPPPFRVEPKGVIKICSSSETVFPFQITVDTLSEITDTLKIELYYEGERMDISYVTVTGYPPRQVESSSSPDWLVPLVFIGIFVTIVATVLLIRARRKTRLIIYEQCPPSPPPPLPPTSP